MRFEPVKRSRWTLSVLAVLLASPLLGAASEPVREPAFELAGLAKLEGDASFALLQEPELTNGVPVLVRQGQFIGSYRLVAVEDDRVLLESANGVITVLLGGSKASSGATAVVAPRPMPAPEARPAPSVTAEAPPNPVAAVPQDAPSPESTMTAEESVDAALKGTPGGKVLDMLKKAFGLGDKP